LQRTLELELIRKCRGGQSRFYEPLVRAYEPTELRLAVGMMGNAEDAKDALQLAFIKTYKTLPRFDLSRPFGPWFYQILRNQCRDMLRSRKAKFSVEALDEWLDQRPAEAESTLEERLVELEGRLFAKTGTISNVNSLSSYLVRADGQDVIFSILTNGSGPAPQQTGSSKRLMSLFVFWRTDIRTRDPSRQTA
jgi:RNA polymerase sigma factor (sigma-70 family)